MPASLSVSLLEVQYDNPFMNAAGVLCSTREDLNAMVHSASGTLVTKSATLEPRQGNPVPRYKPLPLGSINSMGLPNQGFAFYAEFVQAHQGKPLFVSLSGLSAEENVMMVKQLNPIIGSKHLLELNLSCPNVPGKPQVGYDFPQMEEYLTKVSDAYEHPFGIKLPPYFDMAHFDAAAAIINRFPKVQFITCVNSIGNGLIIDVETEQVVIKPKQGFGGIGGQYILPTALANVNAFYRRCPGKYVNGSGGVFSGTEAFMHILAGATLVQVGTALQEEGPGIFARLNEELEAIMKKKGYKTLDEFRGKVKTMDA